MKRSLPLSALIFPTGSLNCYDIIYILLKRLKIDKGEDMIDGHVKAR